jgi:hypothetical protein
MFSLLKPLAAGDMLLADQYLDKLSREFIRLHEVGDEGLVRVRTLRELTMVTIGDVLKSLRKLLWEAARSIPKQKTAGSLDQDDIHTWSKEGIERKDLASCKHMIDKLEKVYGGREGESNTKQLKQIRSLYVHIPNKSPLALASLEGSPNMVSTKHGYETIPSDKKKMSFFSHQLCAPG